MQKTRKKKILLTIFGFAGGPFRDVRVVFSGTPKNLMNELKEKVRLLGGEYLFLPRH